MSSSSRRAGQFLRRLFRRDNANKGKKKKAATTSGPSMASKDACSSSSLMKLPNASAPPEDEFPSQTYLSSVLMDAQVYFGRIGRIGFRRTFDAQTGGVFSLLFLTVYGTSCLEGAIQIQSASPVPLDFLLHYGWYNTLASCTWGQESAHTICAYLGYDPALILKSVPLDASSQLSMRYTSTARSVLATFGIVGQLIRMVTLSIEAGDVYNRRIWRGREPLVGGYPERVVRICGRDSNVTHTSVQRYGRHIVPVVESIGAARRMMPPREEAKHPFFVHIEKGAYGKPRSWDALVVCKEAMLRSTTGKHILCMEADATCEGSLLKGGGDLTIEDATQAFKNIELRGEVSLKGRFRSLRVYLGDIDQKFSTGGGRAFTLRDRVEERKEVDVIIDAAAPVLKRIVAWAKREGKRSVKIAKDEEKQEQEAVVDTKSEKKVIDKVADKVADAADKVADAAEKIVLGETDSPKPVIVLETSSEVYYDTLSRLLSENGIDTIDVTEYVSPASQKQERGRKTLPRLIMHERTEETVNAVRALASSGSVDPKQCCAVVDKKLGLDALEGYERMEVICSAIIHDDIFRSVRLWTRMGYSSSDIQAALDGEYGEFYSLGGGESARDKSIVVGDEHAL